MGGPAAVSDAVLAELRGRGIAVERRFGADRVATSLAVADHPALAGTSDPLLVASALRWPDAVAGSALAAARGWPLLLTWPDRLAPEVERLVRSRAGGVVLIGGSGVLADDVQDALGIAAG